MIERDEWIARVAQWYNVPVELLAPAYPLPVDWATPNRAVGRMVSAEALAAELDAGLLTEHEARAHLGLPNPVPDVLDRIDDALAERCACGCGRPLSPTGPSAWFATDQCQWRWHGARATGPDDVYGRPDAAPCPASDRAVVPLTPGEHLVVMDESRGWEPAPPRERWRVWRHRIALYSGVTPVDLGSHDRVTLVQ